MKRNRLLNQIITWVMTGLTVAAAILVICTVFERRDLLEPASVADKAQAGTENGESVHKDAQEDQEKGQGIQEDTVQIISGEEQDPAEIPSQQSNEDTEKQHAGENANGSARELLDQMSLEEKIAQMFMITPEALTKVEGVTQAMETTKESYHQYPVGGIIYFEQNIVNPEQLSKMSENITSYSRNRSGVGAFISTDEEGGRVTRLAKNTEMKIQDVGAMRKIGDTGNSQLAYEVGNIIGGYLSSNGINVDFAPVADVDTDSNQSVVGDRSFGSDPQTVANMVAKEIQGLQEAGVSGAMKHFPGHGATKEDSHDGFAVSDKTLEQLRECELIPFKAGIEADCDFIMVGHISLPNIIGDNLPASLSSKIVTELLREEMGYNGIIVTDALNMGAIVSNYTSDEAAVRAVLSGVDMLLMPSDFHAAYTGLQKAVQSGEISEERINESVLRILELKVKRGV